MKAITLIFALTSSILANGDDEKFVSIMSSNIQAIYKAQTNEEIQKAVSAFDRIANVEKTRWEPLYYSAFGNVLMANKETDASRKDRYLDVAQDAVDKMKSIKPDDSEIMTMQGFIHMIRVTINPAVRGQEFSSKAFAAYNKALKINSENPRALSLLAQMEFGVAQFFGASTTEACDTVDRAAEKFENEKPVNLLTPTWGKEVNQELKNKCH